MPPRHGKSDTATQKFPSWVLGKHPEWPFIVASYSQELATDFGQGTRDLMDSTNYKAVFETRLRPDTTAKAKWRTEEGGGYTAVGVGGAITGRGFKVGIVDDPFKNREEADSPVTRESVHKWWKSTFYTRQEGNTLIVLILTRWHDDDLAGRLLKEEIEAGKFATEDNEHDYDKWEILEFKAIAEEDEEYRKKGEALWPKKFSVGKLNRTKRSLGGYEWSALYQQNPVDEENQEFKREWLQYKAWADVQVSTTRKFATIDSALSKGATSDFTGVTRNYVDENNDWNIKCQRYRVGPKALIDLIFTLHKEGMETIGIEEGVYLSAIEPFMKDKMEEYQIFPNVVVLKHNQIMKETRIRGLIPRYENKKIFHIEDACVDLEEEYFRFPKSAHDDCLDSLAYQNQIAMPPTTGIGDRFNILELEKSLTKEINDQSGTIIIGVSTALPIKYVIANKQGVFFNRTIPNNEDARKEFESLLRRWDKVFMITDSIGDTLWLKQLQQTFPGKIQTAWLQNDKKDKSIKWGEGESYGQVDVSKNAILQQIVDEIRGERLMFHGNLEDWTPMFDEILNLYRMWEVDSLGEKVSFWESSGPQHFIKSLIFCRVGLEKFSESEAKIITDNGLGALPIARVFNDGFTF